MPDDSISTIDLLVQRYRGYVRVDRRRQQRNIRRNGRTMQAAARLACYRLRVVMRRDGYVAIDDIELMTHNDIYRDAVDVAAIVRCVRPPDGIEFPDNYRIPSHLHHLTIVDTRVQ